MYFLGVRSVYAHDYSGSARSLYAEMRTCFYFQERTRQTPKLILIALRANQQQEKEYYADKYARVAPVEEAVKQKLGKDITVRTDTDEKITVVIGADDDWDYRLYHLLQAYLPILMPWQFENNPLTDAEKAMLNALSGRYPSIYLETAAKVFAELHLRELAIKTQLSKLGRGLRERKIQEMQNIINAYQDQADRLIREFEQAMSKKKDANITLLGLQAQSEEKQSTDELIDLFMRNENYSLFASNDTKFSFLVYTTLTNFDPDSAMSKLKNSRSYFYSNSSWNDEDTKLFFTNLFGHDPKLKIRVYASYELNIVSGSASARSLPNMKQGYIANPHIDHYHCMGTYPPEIEKLLLAGEYVEAVFQCAVSAASLNMEDAYVMPYFVDQLTSFHNECVELPNGNVVTPEKALEWLKSGDSSTEVRRTVEEILLDDDDDEEENEEQPEGDFHWEEANADTTAATADINNMFENAADTAGEGFIRF